MSKLLFFLWNTDYFSFAHFKNFILVLGPSGLETFVKLNLFRFHEAEEANACLGIEGMMAGYWAQW